MSFFNNFKRNLKMNKETSKLKANMEKTVQDNKVLFELAQFYADRESYVESKEYLEIDGQQKVRINWKPVDLMVIEAMKAISKVQAVSNDSSNN